jgi:hypothetical protein
MCFRNKNLIQRFKIGKAERFEKPKDDRTGHEKFGAEIFLDKM